MPAPGFTFRKDVKNSVGNCLNHFRPGSRWGTQSTATAPSGSHIGHGKQAEWQLDADKRSQVLLDGKQIHIFPEHYL